MSKQSSISSFSDGGASTKKRRLTGSLSLEAAPLDEQVGTKAPKQAKTKEEGSNLPSDGQKKRRSTNSKEENAIPDAHIKEQVFDSGLARPTKAETYSRLNSSEGKTCGREYLTAFLKNAD